MADIATAPAKNYRFALSPISTTLALSPSSTRRRMASERDFAATFSAHASTLAFNSAGSRMPPNGSRPPVAGRPLFVFAFIDFFIPGLSVRIEHPNGGWLVRASLAAQQPTSAQFVPVTGRRRGFDPALFVLLRSIAMSAAMPQQSRNVAFLTVVSTGRRNTGANLQ
jgi:hypothetical protein